MKKIYALLMTLLVFLFCTMIFSCDTARGNDSDSNISEQESTGSDLKNDIQVDIPNKDHTEKFFEDIEIANKNLEDKILISDYSKELDELKSFIDNADFEITDFKDNTSSELNNMSKIVFKNKSLYAKSEDGRSSFYAQILENQIVLLTTDNGKTLMKNIPLEISINEDMDFTLDSLMFLTEDDIIPTAEINKLQLKDEYVNSLIDKLAELTKSSELSNLKGIEIYICLDKYDLGIIGLEIYHKTLGTYNAEILCDSLISGVGAFSFSLTKGKEQLFNMSLELKEFQIQGITLELASEEMNLSLTATNDLIELTMEAEGEEISLLCEQKESKIESLYDYFFKIEIGKESLEVNAIANSKKNEEMEYSITLKLKEEDGESGGTVKLYSPSKTGIQLNPLEEKYLSRYNIYRKYQSEIDNRALYFVSNGIAYFQNNPSAQLDIHLNPTQYYYLDEIYDVVYLASFEYNMKDNLINYSINIVFDYENHIYFAHRVRTDFKNAEQSILETELQYFYSNACIAYENHTKKYEHLEGDYYHYAYYYREEQGVYLIAKIGAKNELSYRTEKPTTDEFFGELCEMKYINGELIYHNLEFVEFDSQCHMIFKCSDCGDKQRSYKREHDTVDELISEASDTTPRVTVADCQRCGEKFINVGEEISMRIEKATEDLVNNLITLLDENVLSIDNLESYYEITEVIVKNPTNGMNLIIPKIDKYNIISLRKFTQDNIEKVHYGEITLPEGIYSIGWKSFVEESFDNIVLPTSLVYINSYAFDRCSFERLVIPKGVKSLGVYFVNDNDDLKELIIDCENLVAIRVPDSCDNISVLEINGTVKQIMLGSAKIKEITLKEGIEFFSCSYNNYIEKVVFPEAVDNLTHISFSGCSNLKTVSLPYGLKEIEASAFHQCKALRELVIPSSVTEIGAYAFYGVYDIEITIPTSVTEINDLAFHGATVKIIYEGTQAQWDAMEVKLNEKSTVVCQG